MVDDCWWSWTKVDGQHLSYTRGHHQFHPNVHPEMMIAPQVFRGYLDVVTTARHPSLLGIPSGLVLIPNWVSNIRIMNHHLSERRLMIVKSYVPMLFSSAHCHPQPDYQLALPNTQAAGTRVSKLAGRTPLHQLTNQSFELQAQPLFISCSPRKPVANSSTG